MSANIERPKTDDRQALPGGAVRLTNWSLNPRRRKETLLPHITALALEGHSSETIALKIGMPARTVRHWLQELRKAWIAEAAGGTAEMLAIAMERLTAIYRTAMEEWRESLEGNGNASRGGNARARRRTAYENFGPDPDPCPKRGASDQGHGRCGSDVRPETPRCDTAGMRPNPGRRGGSTRDADGREPAANARRTALHRRLRPCGWWTGRREFGASDRGARSRVILVSGKYRQEAPEGMDKLTGPHPLPLSQRERGDLGLFRGIPAGLGQRIRGSGPAA